MLKQFLEADIKEEIESASYDNKEAKTDAEYFETYNPDTGLRYDIPLITAADPEYFYKYVYYMKMKERSPDTFDKLMNWD